MAQGEEATANVASALAVTQKREEQTNYAGSRWAEGAVVAGRYRLERVLGEGGMGIVWAAMHTVTRKPVALKFVKGEAVSAEVRRRMLREARAASAVRHPNVIEVYDILELADGAPVMVMELLTGESLADRLRRELAMPVRELAQLLLPVVSALGAAHALGIVHRDLKPENIFLVDGSKDRIKVLDFGVAKLTALEGDAARTTGMTESRTMLGTPCYMAPEQAFGERDIDHRADIWALGIILYECLSGVLPTRAENLGQVLKIVLTGAITPLQELAPDVPQDMAMLVNRMLSRARERRPGDVKEVAVILAQYADAAAPNVGQSAVPIAAAAEPSREANEQHLVRDSDKADPFAETARLESPPQSPAPGEPLKRVGRRTMAWRMADLVAMAAFSAAMLTPQPWWAPPPPAPSASAAPRPTAITDLLPPMSTSPQAQAMYAAALQAIRDGNKAQAKENLERAISIDPSFAAAHLRIAIAHLYGKNVVYENSDHSKARAHYARALEGRARLSDRDRAVLEAFEPVLEREFPAPDDAARCAERFREVTTRYPYDAELFSYLAVALQGIDEEGSLRAAQRSIELDSEFARGWLVLSGALSNLQRHDESIRALNRCLAISPHAADCHIYLAMHQIDTGQCEKASEQLRAALSSAGNMAPGTYSLQASVLFALGHPEIAITEVLRQKWTLMHEPARRTTELFDLTKLYISTGRFAHAEERSREGIQLTATALDDPTGWRYLESSAWLIDVYEETGRNQDAARVAADALERSDLAAKQYAPALRRVLLHAGTTPKPSLDMRSPQLSTPYEESDSSTSASTSWAGTYGEWIETFDEAGAALASLPIRGGTELDPAWYHATIGIAYQIVGKPTDAAPVLRRAMNTCSGLKWPRQYIRIGWFLGQALEQTGDILGACAAYQTVIDRWGNASPRSVTAERSKSRMKAIGCAPTQRTIPPG